MKRANMKVATTLAMICALAVLGLADSALAERVSIVKQDKVQGKCGESGGIYFPPNKQGTYGCINRDGSGIVCGGVTKIQKKTCDTFLVAPRRLPTRNEAEKADQGQK